MSGDSLFPFPEPNFLWIHKIYIYHRDDLVEFLDDRGATRVFLPPKVGGVPSGEEVMGYLTAPNSSRDLSGYIQRQQITAVALLPLNTVIDHDCYIYCEDAQLPPFLAGAYSIDTVRATISHLRVMCGRFRTQWGNVEFASNDMFSVSAGASATADGGEVTLTGGS